MFRLCVPAALGGAEAEPRVLVECVETIARGDASAGWCVAVCATSGLLAGYLADDAAREIFGRPEAIVGGVFAPRGHARPVDGGYRVSGRWPFASGCGHCDWLMAGCTLELDGPSGVATLPGGRSEVRLVLAPAADVRIHDTWHVSGLRGTGSHDIEFEELLIPSGRSASVFTDPPLATGPLYAFPLFGLLAVAIASVSLGVARAALDELVRLAGVKTPTGSRRRLADRAAVQADIARDEAALFAARGFLLSAASRAYEAAARSDTGVAGRPQVPLRDRVELRLAATHAVTVGAEIATNAYRNGGGGALYETSPLQRCLRDAHAATQHMLVAPATWELTGRLLLGLEADTSQL